MLGVKTVGNATLIAYEGAPVLATDPWLDPAGAYFGSWSLLYDIPPAERQDILDAKYVWLSHGHPDHLDASSLALFDKDRIFLLPQHRGDRILNDLKGLGFNVRAMPDREWVQLSPRIRAMCVSDYYQDAILLVDVNGRIFVNINDAADRGWLSFVRRVTSQYKHRYLLKLLGYGDADMINFRDQDGKLVLPRAALRIPLSQQMEEAARIYNCNYIIPFSTFHQYRRADSVWANEFATPLSAYANGAGAKSFTYIQPFSWIDAETGHTAQVAVMQKSDLVLTPEQFGDNWSDMLSAQDVTAITSYFRRREHVWNSFGWLNFRVGGKDNVIDMHGSRSTGIVFEVPRGSLMAAIEYEIFDDLLIGNFMRTTLIGVPSLYPNFTPYVAKYADNGRAYSSAEVESYIENYRRRSPREFFLHKFATSTERVVRLLAPKDTPLYELAKRGYYTLRQHR